MAEGNGGDGIEIVPLQVPREVDEECQAERTPYGTIFDDWDRSVSAISFARRRSLLTFERHHGVRRLGLPPEEDREEQHSQDQWQQDMDLHPALLTARKGSVSEREWHQKAPQCSDDQNDADDIELPKQRDSELQRA